MQHKTDKSMELDEILQRKLNIERLSELANRPDSDDPHAEMDPIQKSYLIDFLTEMVREKEEQMKELLSRLDSLQQKLDESIQLQKSSQKVEAELRKTIAQLQYEKATLVSRLGIRNKEQFDTSKSRKGKGGKRTTKGKNDGRDDFDGTKESLTADGSETAQSAEGSSSESQDVASQTDSQSVYHGPSREGWKYDIQRSKHPITHNSDRTQLEPGSVILKSRMRRVRQVRTIAEEHLFEEITYMTPSGEIRTGYFPMAEEKGAELYKEIVPGTGITIDTLAFLLSNRYQMSSPAYREAKHLLPDLDWKTCRQSLLNWEDKGVVALKKLLPALKKKALQEGAIVNVDETWYRFQTHFGHEKVYIWCLVNRKQKTVIFFYDDLKDKDGKTLKEGSRSRSVLKNFLGDAKLKSLQSDGYDAYFYLDDELMDIEHLCCMAHVMVKAKDAASEGSKEAVRLVQLIGSLYHKEDGYEGLSSAEIYKRRNDASTENIVKKLRAIVLEVKARIACAPEQVSDLLKRAVNYLDKFWNQVFAYRKDGDYTIDNMLAERAIRPITGQRKNSLFFCSRGGAEKSCLINTFVETCKQHGVSFRNFIRELMLADMAGEKDYDALLSRLLMVKK